MRGWYRVQEVCCEAEEGCSSANWRSMEELTREAEYLRRAKFLLQTVPHPHPSPRNRFAQLHRTPLSNTALNDPRPQSEISVLLYVPMNSSRAPVCEWNRVA